ncbi:MAG: pyridoxal phosphate-dependent aminotransferase [Patescibacteria group bacterium]
MRVNIVHPDSGELHYEIRSIIDFAEHLKQTGIDITWENIGDPVAKGEQLPEWIRDIVADAAKNDMSSYGYSPTQGLEVARNYLSETRSLESNVKLAPDDILFFNGLGDAITTMYTWLNSKARVLGPNPAYPSHSSLEAVHSGATHLTYRLNPDNGWLPDMQEVRDKVANNPDIAALLIINPDNPTGMVYPRHILEEFVAIAKEFNLFLIADEIYANLTYNPEDFISLASLANKVPTIIMRGLSKEIPWPGSRCGWIEFCYIAEDPDFARYAQAIEEAKMTEVCSTTLPQSVLPKILGDERYKPYVEQRRNKYAKRAAEAHSALGGHPLLKVVEPRGAFYLSVAFTDDFVQGTFNEPAANPFAQKLLDAELEQIPESDFDKRFCYQLMARTGICVVPLSTGFNSESQGFRMTLLEADDATFTKTLQTIKEFCS